MQIKQINNSGFLCSNFNKSVKTKSNNKFVSMSGFNSVQKPVNLYPKEYYLSFKGILNKYVYNEISKDSDKYLSAVNNVFEELLQHPDTIYSKKDKDFNSKIKKNSKEDKIFHIVLQRAFDDEKMKDIKTDIFNSLDTSIEQPDNFIDLYDNPKKYMNVLENYWDSHPKEKNNFNLAYNNSLLRQSELLELGLIEEPYAFANLIPSAIVSKLKEEFPQDYKNIVKFNARPIPNDGQKLIHLNSPMKKEYKEKLDNFLSDNSKSDCITNSLRNALMLYSCNSFEKNDIDVCKKIRFIFNLIKHSGNEKELFNRYIFSEDSYFSSQQIEEISSYIDLGYEVSQSEKKTKLLNWNYHSLSK